MIHLSGPDHQRRASLFVVFLALFFLVTFILEVKVRGSACDVPSGSLDDRQWNRLCTEGCLIGLKNKSLIPELSGSDQISVFHNPEVVVKFIPYFTYLGFRG